MKVEANVNDDAIFSTDSTESEPPFVELQPATGRPKLWPRILHYCICLLVLGFGAASLGASISIASIITGVFVGQAMLLAVISGLLGRFWLAGVWRSTFLGVIAVLVIFGMQNIGFSNTENFIANLLSTSAIAFVAPLVVLCTSSPLFLMRYFFDWRFVPKTAPSQHRASIGTGDFFLVVTCVASMMFMTKVPQAVWEISAWTFWTQAMLSLIFLAILSFLATVPVVWFIFRCRRPLTRWGSSIAWSIASVSVAMTWTWYIQTTPTGFAEVIIVPVAATIVFISGLAVLDYSGFRLNRIDRGSTASIPIAAGGQDSSGGKDRRSQLTWVVGTLTVAMVSSLTLAIYESSRHSLEVELSELAAQLRSDGGDILCKDGKPYRIIVGKSATDDTIKGLSKYSTIQELSLANSQISDQTLSQLANWFPNLLRLDVGFTKVTPIGLKQLVAVDGLYQLGLAGTSIDDAQLIDVLKQFSASQSPTRVPIVELDLSETEWTAEEIAKLPPEVVRLKIRKCGYDDQGISTISKSRHWLWLDISQNPIRGSGVNYSSIQYLVAHDVPLQDKYFVPRSLNGCDLSNTQLTDAALKACRLIQILKIGDGQFTDQGVTALMGFGGIQELHLNGNQITGDCLLPQPPQQNHLSLQRSGINDSVLAKIAKHWKNIGSYVTGLSLAETQISELGLRELSGCSISHLDLSRTRVTAKSIAELEFTNLQAIYVDFNQFTADELRLIRSRHRVLVGERIKTEQ